MKYLGSLYLVWRQSNDMDRHVVGEIKKSNGEFCFRYLIDQKKADEIGFTSYVAFSDLTKTYTKNVLDTFGHRLINPIREDIQKYYDYWEIDKRYTSDKYYMLAHTQGLLAIDNFELLADYTPLNGVSFISEICDISRYNVSPELLTEGDMLRWEYDPKNEHDNKAVKVFKNDVFLGYVKIVHSRAFYKKGGQDLQIKIKDIDKNGRLNRVFIRIYK
ncbi:MAG: HIRAN domain-containing protein [Planctomycetaceae bacterium]|jgi:hypothetical protein|nr:HIRAN domain-containing protein [Planctomycetaceae bacterium]